VGRRYFAFAVASLQPSAHLIWSSSPNSIKPMLSVAFASFPIVFLEAPRFQSSPRPGPLRTDLTASHSWLASLSLRGESSSLPFLNWDRSSSFSAAKEGDGRKVKEKTTAAIDALVKLRRLLILLLGLLGMVSDSVLVVSRIVRHNRNRETDLIMVPCV